MKKITARQKQSIQDAFQALIDDGRMTTQDVSDIVQTFEEQGFCAVFGFGSLATSEAHVRKTFYKDINKFYNAELKGFEKGFFVKDIRYQNHIGETGYTLALNTSDDPDIRANAVTKGAVLERDLDDAVDFITIFVNRENPKSMPIYKIQMVEVDGPNGKVKALTCVADKNGPLYVGYPIKPGEKSNSPNATTTEDMVKQVALGVFNTRLDENTFDIIDDSPASARTTNMAYIIRLFTGEVERFGEPSVPEMLKILYAGLAYRDEIKQTAQAMENAKAEGLKIDETEFAEAKKLAKRVEQLEKIESADFNPVLSKLDVTVFSANDIDTDFAMKYFVFQKNLANSQKHDDGMKS